MGGKRVRCVSSLLRLRERVTRKYILFIPALFVSSQAFNHRGSHDRLFRSSFRYFSISSFLRQQAQQTYFTKRVFAVARKLKEARAKRNLAGYMSLSGRHIKMEIGFC